MPVQSMGVGWWGRWGDQNDHSAQDFEQFGGVEDLHDSALDNLGPAEHEDLGELGGVDLLAAETLVEDEVVALLAAVLLVDLGHLVDAGVALLHLGELDGDEPAGEVGVEGVGEFGVFGVVEEVVGGEVGRGVVVGVVGVAEDVVVVAELFGVGDEGDVGVVHDEFVVVEDVGDEAEQFAAVAVEAGVELLVDLEQLQQFGQFLLVAEQVEPREAGQFAVVEVDDHARELRLDLLQDELRVHELVRQQLDFPLVVAVRHVLVQLAVHDDLLRQGDLPQVVDPHPLQRLVDLQQSVVLLLDHHHVVVLGEEVDVHDVEFVPARQDEPHVEAVLQLVGTQALEELLGAAEVVDPVVGGGDVVGDQLVEVVHLLLHDEVEAVELGVDVHVLLPLLPQVVLPADHPVHRHLLVQLVRLVDPAHQSALHHRHVRVGPLLPLLPLLLLLLRLHPEADVVAPQDRPVRVQFRHPREHVAVVHQVVVGLGVQVAGVHLRLEFVSSLHLHPGSR